MAISSTLQDLGKKVENLAKQRRFAAIVTLTRLAKICRDAVRENLSREFTLRNKHTQRGIMFRGATKANPEAQVFGVDRYLVKHEEGGTIRRPGFERRIPQAIHEVANIAESRVIPRGKRASTITKTKVRKNQPFVRTINRKKGVFVRTTDDRFPLRMLYLLTEEPIRIEKKGWFFDVVNKSYDQNFDDVYEASLQQILATAR